MKPIHQLPPEERPREKLLKLGPQSLSDQELLAILIGSGNSRRGVHELARLVLNEIDRRGAKLSAHEISAINGIGSARAALISAALEFSRRRIRPNGTRISGPHDVLPLVRHLADRPQEHFIAITLNGAHEVIALRTITVGLVNATQIHPREVFADAITDRACALIVAHNHPSGQLTPSREDMAVTERLRQAGELLGIRLLDHVIFTNAGAVGLLDGETSRPAALLVNQSV